jgi:hypothetical protein
MGKDPDQVLQSTHSSSPDARGRVVLQPIDKALHVLNDAAAALVFAAHRAPADELAQLPVKVAVNNGVEFIGESGIHLIGWTTSQETYPRRPHPHQTVQDRPGDGARQRVQPNETKPPWVGERKIQLRFQERAQAIPPRILETCFGMLGKPSHCQVQSGPQQVLEAAVVVVHIGMGAASPLGHLAQIHAATSTDLIDKLESAVE